jgi:hypothetical protein
MAVFMEENGVEARNGCSRSEESLRSQFKTTAFCRDRFSPHFQFSSRQIHGFLTEQHCLPGDCEVCSVGTATDGFISEGGDAAML